MNEDIDLYISKISNWQDEIILLRKILLACNLTEELKWGKPCYTYQQNNIVIIQAFKEYFALGFFKGAILNDDHHLLKKAGENTQALKQMRFTDVIEIKKLEPIIYSYIQEAIELDNTGQKITFKKNTELVLIDELMERINTDSTFKTAFASLTPGRQRAYNIFFSEAKQSATRESRIEKCMPRILNGKGLNDCICGLSKRLPNCDGSHKYVTESK